MATVLGIVVVACRPRAVTRVPGALRSLIPRVAVPPTTRTEFTAAVPVLAAVWMLAGLSGGLAPSLVRSVFLVNSGLLNGLSGFSRAGDVGVIGVTFARSTRGDAMTVGMYASVVGVVGIVGGVSAGSLAIMIIGQAIAGVGFGASFTAALRLIVPLATAHSGRPGRRRSTSSPTSAFGVPVVLAGQAAGPFGMAPTVFWYTTVTVLLALVSLPAQLKLGRQMSSAAPTPGGRA